MSGEEIKIRIEELRKAQEEITNRILELRKECPHVMVDSIATDFYGIPFGTFCKFCDEPGPRPQYVNYTYYDRDLTK